MSVGFEKKLNEAILLAYFRETLFAWGVTFQIGEPQSTPQEEIKTMFFLHDRVISVPPFIGI